MEEKGEIPEKREIYWQERKIQKEKELKLEVEEIGQIQEKRGFNGRREQSRRARTWAFGKE